MAEIYGNTNMVRDLWNWVVERDAFINLIIKIQQLGIAVVLITIIRGN